MSKRRFPIGEVRGSVASAAVHVALIALAIAAQASRAADRIYGAPREQMVLVDAARWTSARSARPGRPAPSVRRAARRPRGVLPPLQFNPAEVAQLTDLSAPTVATPDVDLAAVASDVGDEFAGTDGLEDAVGDMAGHAYRKASSSTLYTWETVDRIAAPVPRNPKPRYPPALVMMQVEGTFVVRFVVDTTGLVEPGSLQFPESAHEYFVKSVRDALLRSRYYPAEFGGQRVRQQVEQTFSFVIATPK